MDLGSNGTDDADHSDNELLAAQAHIWNHLFSFINSMSLKCAVQLGIPDIIHKHGHPISLGQLIHALPINHEKSQFLYRLMRFLTHSGFFVKEKISANDEEEGYALTPPSKLLLKDGPFSMRPYVLVVLDPLLTDPWHHFCEWFQNYDKTSFETCHGKAFWELASHDPKIGRLFNESMTNDATLVSSVLIRSCKDVFLGLNSMVDVGGGTGTLAHAIADAFPHLKCTVLDLSHVVDGLKGSKNVNYVGGNMFEAIPPADAVFLKCILHNWSDEKCVEILKKCKEAIPNKGGKVIIVDMLLKNKHKGDGSHAHHHHESIETQLFYDMEMMVLVNGRERDEKGLAKLFSQAGFNDYKVTPLLGLRSLIEVYD